MLKRIMNRDNLRAHLVKTLLKKGALDGGRNTAPVKILGQKYFYVLIGETIEDILHLAEYALNLEN